MTKDTSGTPACVLAALCAMFVVLAPAAGAFSLFGGSSTNKPPKLHVLLRPANDLIEEAQMCELNGEADAAVENYRKAIAELERIAAENPERAATAEFAPLRNKVAVCNTQIDAIKLEQVSAAECKMAVTDTTELQRRYDELRGITNKVAEAAKKSAAAGADAAKDAKAESAPKPVEAARDARPRLSESEIAEMVRRMDAAESAPPPAPKPQLTLQDHLENAKDFISGGEPAKAMPDLVAVLKFDPENWQARYLMAYAHVAQGDHAAAETILRDMLEDRPDDVPALLLRAASLMENRGYSQAQKAIEKAIRVNPKYYAGYYNMASLILEMGGGREAARKYYEAGRTAGGPVDADLERDLGIKGR